MIASDNGTQFETIATSLGWIAVCFMGDSVVRTSVGYRSELAALNAIGGHKSRRRPSARQRDILQRLNEFAEGKQVDFADIELTLPNLTDFQKRVIKQCRQLRWGDTATYGTIAARAGRPRAARAVGTAMAKNPVPIIVPCHRVVSATGLGGFSAPGGCNTKRRLLRAEGSHA